MKYLELFEQYKKPFREVDLQKIWNLINNIEFINIYNDGNILYPVDFFQNLLKEMLIDKEIEFGVIKNDDEISYLHNGRVKSIFLKGDIFVNLYDDKWTYFLARFYNGKMDKEKTIRIYNSKITETEKKIEEVEMKLDAKKYNL